MKGLAYFSFVPSVSHQNRPDRRSVCLPVSVITIISVAIAVIVVAAIALYDSKCDQKVREVDIGHYGLCCPCDGDLVREFSEEKWERFGENENSCCLKDAENINFLLQATKLRTSFEDSNYEANSGKASDIVLPRPRPAAHMFIDPHKLYDHKEIAWTTESATAFTTRKVELENGTVTVPVGGHYYIYSFLTYKSEHLISSEIINHYVYKENKHLPKTIRQVVLTDKQMRLTGNLRYQRSFLASVLKLSKEDAISVNVTNITAVYPYTMANFFGLFYISP